jgi:nitrite reductase (NADH) small subunit
VVLAPVAAIPPGEGREFEIAGEHIAVFRNRSGGVFAVQAQCPHKGGPLADGLLGGATLICPLHSWKFDLTSGEALNGNCGLKIYPVRLDEANRIALTLEMSTELHPQNATM